ncbi:MAG: response regulator [Vicinamibacterales bacterium]
MIRVLLLEDSPSDTFMLIDSLKSTFAMEFEVTPAETLAEGTALVGGESYDVAIVDLNLPDSEGLQTYTRLREAAPEVPIVILSGQADDALTRDLLAAGALDCLPKGLSPAMLARSIRFAVERLAIMTALRKRTRELVDSRERLRTIIDMHPDAAIVVDEAGTVQFVNPPGAAMFGRTAEDFVGHPFGLPLAAHEEIEVDIRRGTGHGVATMRVVPVTWRGQPARIAFLHDVTEQREFAERMSQLNVMLEERVAERTRERERTTQMLQERNQQIEAFYHMLCTS